MSHNANFKLMITFIEHKETGYAMRTWDNARLSDLTIAFAVDFNTPGEILTRKAAYGKYYAININNLQVSDEALIDLFELLFLKDVKVINFAGNGINNLKPYSQEQINNFMYLLIKTMVEGYKLFSTRNGGQSGIDLASAIASDRLCLETICLAPKNWMFRNIEGKDICNEHLFIKRFGPQYDITDIL